MTLSRVLSAACVAAAVGLFAPAPSLAQQVSAGGDDGGLRAPTQEEIQAQLAAMGESLSQSDVGLKEEVRVDGTSVLDLGGRFESVSVAKVSGGAVTVGCATNEAEAKAFFAPAAPATLEER